MKLTVDTGVILALVLNETGKNLEAIEDIFTAVKNRMHTAFISTITVSEIFACFSKLGEAKKAVETIVFLKESGIELVDVNETIAKNGGLFKAKYSKAKKGFSYADAIILSTALYKKSDVLLTHDPEFSCITEISIAAPENL